MAQRQIRVVLLKGPTWLVGDRAGLKRLWLRHEGLLHSVEGTHRSAEPVSKQTVRSCDGSPSFMLP